MDRSGQEILTPSAESFDSFEEQQVLAEEPPVAEEQPVAKEQQQAVIQSLDEVKSPFEFEAEATILRAIEQNEKETHNPHPSHPLEPVLETRQKL